MQRSHYAMLWKCCQLRRYACMFGDPPLPGRHSLRSRHHGAQRSGGLDWHTQRAYARSTAYIWVCQTAEARPHSFASHRDLSVHCTVPQKLHRVFVGRRKPCRGTPTPPGRQGLVDSTKQSLLISMAFWTPAIPPATTSVGKRMGSSAQWSGGNIAEAQATQSHGSAGL